VDQVLSMRKQSPHHGQSQRASVRGGASREGSRRPQSNRRFTRDGSR
jgi:hypothetical protein